MYERLLAAMISLCPVPETKLQKFGSAKGKRLWLSASSHSQLTVLFAFYVLQNSL